MNQPVNIAIFASGSGSNAEAIIKYFANHPTIKVKMILSNKKDAYVLQRADKLGVPAMVFGRHELYDNDKLIQLLEGLNIDYIVLAGFLWLVPQSLLQAFPNRIINVHPALLPKFGGKGMYGMKVHEAVVDAKEKESGITIHLLNEKYDEGRTLFQASVAVNENDSPETVAQKIHALEHKHYPEQIEKWIASEQKK